MDTHRDRANASERDWVSLCATTCLCDVHAKQQCGMKNLIYTVWQLSDIPIYQHDIALPKVELRQKHRYCALLIDVSIVQLNILKILVSLKSSFAFRTSPIWIFFSMCPTDNAKNFVFSCQHFYLLAWIKRSSSAFVHIGRCFLRFFQQTSVFLFIFLRFLAYYFLFNNA